MTGYPSDPVRVLVVDDDEDFRNGLAELLTLHGLDVVATARDARDAIDVSRMLRPDVVLMDVEMPGANGIEATPALLRVCPEAKVVMLTVSGDGSDVLEALLAGATGYLVKGTEPAALVAGIRAAAAGDALLSPGLAAKLLGRVQAAAPVAAREGERGHRARALPQPVHGAEPHLEHPREAPDREPHRGGRVRHPQRARQPVALVNAG